MRFNPPTMLRRMFCLVSLLGISALARTSDRLNRAIRVNVPFPSILSDAFARSATSLIAADPGVVDVSDHNPGGNTFIGMGAAFNAQPHGISLVLTADTIEAIYPPVDRRLPNDPEDVLLLAIFGSWPFGLTPQSQLNVNPLAEVVALAKARPGVIVKSRNVSLA